MADSDSADESGDYGTPEGDEYSLPASEIEPADPPEYLTNPTIPANLQQNIGTQLGNNSSKEKEKEMADDKEPLLIRVIKDDALTSFEQTTVQYARYGFVIAVVSLSVTFLSLLAGIVAAVIFWGQFQQMAKQSDILGASLVEQQWNAVDSDVATAKQSSILQRQLIQQETATRIDERPWLKFEIEGQKPAGIDPNNIKNHILPMEAGKPLETRIRVTNVGKTTAEKVFGTLIIQVIPKGGNAIFPKKGELHFYKVGQKMPKGKQSIAGTAWEEGTFYPQEVSENNFSRKRFGKDGEPEDAPLTLAEEIAIESGDSYILMLGEVWYSDVFGIRHWTKFCETTIKKPNDKVAIKCESFEAVDHN